MKDQSIKDGAIKMYFQGYKRADIAEILGVSRVTVWHWTRHLLSSIHEFCTCAFCHKKVRRKRSTQIYCSTACNNKAYRRRQKEMKYTG